MAIELPPITWAIPPEGYPGDWARPSVGDVVNYRRSQGLGLVATHAAVLHRPAERVMARAVAMGAADDSRRKLLRIIKAQEVAGRAIAGFSGPQAGEGYSLLLARVSGSQDWITMYNAEVRAASDEMDVDSEGCYSCAGAGGPVARPKWVDVRYTDDYGETQGPSRYEGFDARVLGHEIDHVNGLLIIDRIIEQERPLLWIPTETLKREGDQPSPYRQFLNGPEPVEAWSFVMPYEQGQALSSGELTMEQFRLPG